jgi:hypothetical protein
MSLKLFLAQNFGLIKSTSKIEAAYDSLHADYKAFVLFEKSTELKEYNELGLLLKSPTFLQRKREIQKLSFKGSKEGAQSSEFRKLEKTKRLQKFYKTLRSDDLSRFEEISASEEFATYKKIKAFVKSPKFDSQKKKTENTEEYKKFNEYHRLKESANIQFCEQFVKSKEYANYLVLKDSPERKRFEELQKMIASDEFIARKEYLEDKHKWEKSDDHEKETRFDELKKLPQLINYKKYVNSEALNFFKKWNLVFEDQFNTGKLDHDKWITRSHGGNQALGRNFSQAGDLQAFSEGHNVSIEFNTLKIQARKEPTRGMQWQIPFGFVEKEFQYSSGIVSTAENDWWKNGILEAKVKFNPSEHFVDVICLLGEEASPQINLVEIGAKNRVGLLSKTSSGIHTQSEDINGLRTGESFIFRLEWTSHSLVWKVNDREIFTLNHGVPAIKMHLNIASVVVSEPTTGLPHTFEIEWVRYFQRHQKE